MLLKFAMWFFVTKCAQAQISGEFWWLNDRVAKMHGERASPPKFENLSAFDTDESDKIVFRDNDNHIYRHENQMNPQNGESIQTTGGREAHAHLQDDRIIWPSGDKQNIMDQTIKRNDKQINNTHESPLTKMPEQNIVKINKENNLPQENDILIFSYPNGDKFTWNDVRTTPLNNSASLPNIINETYKNSAILLENNISSANDIEDESEAQNICTYTKRSECCRRQGIVYNALSIKKQATADLNLICCILPLTKTKDINEFAEIYFPDLPCKKTKRYKRSNNEEISIALKQRNVLLQRKYGTQAPKVKPANTQTRIVNEEEYIDPYWNIKNSNLHRNNHPNTNEPTKHDYENDYVEDYVVELPKPGLIGLYSDHKSSTSWSFLKENKGIYGFNTDYANNDDDNDDEDEDDASFFGYSTIDPRLANSKKKKHGRPMKLTTTHSGELSYDSESQTINYQSNPDFQVLQGFKLLNLLRNRSRLYTKNVRKSTITESGADDSKETSVTKLFDVSSEKFGALNGDVEQLFKGCGKILNEPTTAYKEGKQIGAADDGSHPWIALVVRTKRRQDVLCYATLIHPRAAVTAADCVHGTSSGEITVVAGMWDLNERSRSSHRVASIHVDPQYKPGSLANNLALLYWINPLRLGSNIQPTCLAEPPIGENCMLFGWGGFDQAIRTHSRWQRASILSSRECNSRLFSNHEVDLPYNAFCASVKSRGTVTGTGGPLICNVDGRSSAVGIAIWRDSVLVLLPAREWTMRASSVLRAD